MLAVKMREGSRTSEIVRSFLKQYNSFLALWCSVQLISVLDSEDICALQNSHVPIRELRLARQTTLGSMRRRGITRINLKCFHLLPMVQKHSRSLNRAWKHLVVFKRWTKRLSEKICR